MVTDAEPLTGHDSKNARLGVKEKRQMRKKLALLPSLAEETRKRKQKYGTRFAEEDN